MYEFDYTRPTSLDDAARGLGDADAKLVAGGMTLIPTRLPRWLTSARAASFKAAATTA